MSHINIIKEDLNTIGALDSESDNVSPLEMIKMSLNMVKILPSQLEYISGVKLNYAINAYKKIKGSGLLNIVNPKLLEWNKVGELPLANIEDKGIAIARGLSNIAGLFEQFERKQLNI